MLIRTFAPSDDIAQVGIYNEAAGELPKFKPATLDEVRRRSHALDFDPRNRLIAIENTRPVGYISFHANGRLSYPWTRRGFESVAGNLLDQALAAMRERGITKVFAAYRSDWEPQREFFLTHGFVIWREVINYVMDLAEMPTPAARVASAVSPLKVEDIPTVAQLGEGVIQAPDLVDLEKQLLHNPYFPGENVFVLRSRVDDSPIAVGLIVANPAYANPKQVDAGMPCFRAGAFGMEGQHVKKMNGLFSALAAADRDVSPLALDLLNHASFRLQNTDVETLCAQVTSDAVHLARFYKQYFRRQGSFPLYERDL